MRLIETHCHLDYLKAFPLKEILQKCQEANVEKMITISVSPDNLNTVRQIASQHTNVYCTQGIHPHEARKVEDQHLKDIKTNAGTDLNVKAIGEIGLDYHYDNSPREIQKKVFEQQLEIASELDLPVVIHSRDADEDTISILKNFSSKLSKKGVIHSFTSTLKLAEFAIAQSFMLGFNGIITFKNAEDVRKSLRITPLENLLLETDSPFLTPVPHRGKENGPYYLPHVASKMAEIKEVTIDELTEQVFQNTVKLFALT